MSRDAVAGWSMMDGMIITIAAVLIAAAAVVAAVMAVRAERRRQANILNRIDEAHVLGPRDLLIIRWRRNITAQEVEAFTTVLAERLPNLETVMVGEQLAIIQRDEAVAS